MKPKGQTIFIVLMLSLVVIAFFTNRPSFESAESEKLTSGSSSGYPEYDLIPAELRCKMDSLKVAHYNINYTYWYFFDIEDVNKNYYITDAGMKIIAEMPVTDPQALALVDEKIQNNPGIDVDVTRHPDMVIDASASKEEKEKQFKRMRENKDDPSRVWIRYIFPEDTVDFSKLRVAIMADNFSRSPMGMFTSEPYAPKDLDTLPVPVRGYDYFEELMVKELMQHDVFTFYDLKGEVTVELTVGTTASSPNIVKGFSSSNDSYEAYQADGAFVKALNNLKVWWKPGKVGNSPVRVKMPVTFHVDGQTIKMKKESNAVADL